MRFTMTQDNARELPELLRISSRPRASISFTCRTLNYAGRGNINRKVDVILKTTRWAIDLLFDRCGSTPSAACTRSSAPATTMPTAFICCSGWSTIFRSSRSTLRAKLAQWGGNSSGVNVANIDDPQPPSRYFLVGITAWAA